MLVKIYWLLWSLVALVALAFFVTGSFSVFSAVVFGFIAFGLTFMGMMGVLPVIVAHPSIIKTPDEPKQKAVPAYREDAARPFHVLKSA